jgi:hypothetical protein
MNMGILVVISSIDSTETIEDIYHILQENLEK